MEDIRKIMIETFEKIKALDGDTEGHVANRDYLYDKWWDDLEQLFGYPDYRSQM